MRRVLGSFILTIGLLLGWGATMLHLSELSILRTGRLAQASGQLLDNPSVRAALAQSISGSLSPLLGAGINLPPSLYTNIVNQAATQPLVRQEFRTAMNQVQNHLLGQASGPIVLGGRAFAESVASTIAPFAPQIATLLSQQGLSVTIPGTAIPNLGRYARQVNRWQFLLLALAVLFVVLALIIHPSRGAVVRRVGLWLIGISIVNAVIFWAVPTYLLPQIGFSWAQIAAVVFRAVGGPATEFYVELLAAGAAAVIVGESMRRYA